MRIDVPQIDENEDGSAHVVLLLDEEAKAYLIQKGFISILKEAMDTNEDCK